MTAFAAVWVLLPAQLNLPPVPVKHDLEGGGHNQARENALSDHERAVATLFQKIQDEVPRDTFWDALGAFNTKNICKNPTNVKLLRKRGFVVVKNLLKKKERLNALKQKPDVEDDSENPARFASHEHYNRPGLIQLIPNYVNKTEELIFSWQKKNLLPASQNVSGNEMANGWYIRIDPKAAEQDASCEGECLGKWHMDPGIFFSNYHWRPFRSWVMMERDTDRKSMRHANLVAAPNDALRGILETVWELHVERRRASESNNATSVTVSAQGGTNAAPSWGESPEGLRLKKVGVKVSTSGSLEMQDGFPIRELALERVGCIITLRPGDALIFSGDLYHRTQDMHAARLVLQTTFDAELSSIRLFAAPKSDEEIKKLVLSKYMWSVYAGMAERLAETVEPLGREAALQGLASVIDSYGIFERITAVSAMDVLDARRDSIASEALFARLKKKDAIPGTRWMAVKAGAMFAPAQKNSTWIRLLAARINDDMGWPGIGIAASEAIADMFSRVEYVEHILDAVAPHLEHHDRVTRWLAVETVHKIGLQVLESCEMRAIVARSRHHDVQVRFMVALALGGLTPREEGMKALKLLRTDGSLIVRCAAWKSQTMISYRRVGWASWDAPDECDRSSSSVMAIMEQYIDASRVAIDEYINDGEKSVAAQAKNEKHFVHLPEEILDWMVGSSFGALEAHLCMLLLEGPPNPDPKDEDFAPHGLGWGDVQRIRWSALLALRFASPQGVLMIRERALKLTENRDELVSWAAVKAACLVAHEGDVQFIPLFIRLLSHTIEVFRWTAADALATILPLNSPKRFNGFVSLIAAHWKELPEGYFTDHQKYFKLEGEDQEFVARVLEDFLAKNYKHMDVDGSKLDEHGARFSVSIALRRLAHQCDDTQSITANLSHIFVGPEEFAFDRIVELFQVCRETLTDDLTARSRHKGLALALWQHYDGFLQSLVDSVPDSMKETVPYVEKDELLKSMTQSGKCVNLMYQMDEHIKQKARFAVAERMGSSKPPEPEELLANSFPPCDPNKTDVSQFLQTGMAHVPKFMDEELMQEVRIALETTKANNGGNLNGPSSRQYMAFSANTEMLESMPKLMAMLNKTLAEWFSKGWIRPTICFNEVDRDSITDPPEMQIWRKGVAHTMRPRITSAYFVVIRATPEEGSVGINDLHLDGQIHPTTHSVAPKLWILLDKSDTTYGSLKENGNVIVSRKDAFSAACAEAADQIGELNLTSETYRGQILEPGILNWEVNQRRFVAHSVCALPSEPGDLVFFDGDTYHGTQNAMINRTALILDVC